MIHVSRVLRLLRQASVPYELFAHREAFTAQEVAERSHVPGQMMAKVVVLKDREARLVMAVLPASRRIDFEVLRARLGRSGLTLATEHDMVRQFPDCEVGAEPPFGRLYDLPMYLDGCFFGQRDICFQAGNYHEAVRMKLEDYLTLVRPLAGEFCLHPEPAGVGA